MNKKTYDIRKLVVLAMFCALAFSSVFVFKFKVAFLTFDLKDVIITVGGLFFGPLSALAMSLVVAFIEGITISDTGIYGFFMNFLSSAAFSVTASLLYKRLRGIKGAIVGLLSGVLVVTVTMVAFNMLITPLYLKTSMSEVLALIPTLLLPFNLTKAVFNSSLVLMVYKPISYALKRAKLADGVAVYTFDKKSIFVFVLGLLLLVASFAVLIFVLNGRVDWFVNRS